MKRHREGWKCSDFFLIQLKRGVYTKVDAVTVIFPIDSNEI